LKINQDVSVFDSILKAGDEVSHELAENRYAWLQVVKGTLEINGETLNASDGAAVSKESILKIKAQADDTEFLLFDLA
jgi:redox-sensitive bicupin YhaK (pirin superfamily)